MHSEQKDYDLAEALFEDILASQRASLGQTILTRFERYENLGS